MDIKIDTTGLLRKVGFIRRIFSGRRILGIVADTQLKWIQDNFVVQGSLGGRPWAPNRPNTVAAKGHTRILQRTGALKRSFRAKFNIFRGGGRVVVGSGNNLAAFHQFGTRAHDILPRHARRLSFITVQGRVFARRVRHPGVPARPMLPTRTIADAISAAALRRALGRGLATLPR